MKGTNMAEKRLVAHRTPWPRAGANGKPWCGGVTGLGDERDVVETCGLHDLHDGSAKVWALRMASCLADQQLAVEHKVCVFTFN